MPKGDAGSRVGRHVTGYNISGGKHWQQKSDNLRTNTEFHTSAIMAFASQTTIQN
jgi:hypothetical protein